MALVALATVTSVMGQTPTTIVKPDDGATTYIVDLETGAVTLMASTSITVNPRA